MRLLLAPLSLLLAATAVQAENSITLYGTADAGIQHLGKTATGAGQTGFQDSPSTSNRFGLRGSLGLPADWAATVNLEGRYFLDGNGPPNIYGSSGNVTSRLFDRSANLGLSGPYGTFTAGLVNNPVAVAHVQGDIRPAANSGGGIFAWYRNRSIDSTCVDGSCDFTFLRRAVTYRSPQWNGFTASAFYAFTSGNTATSSSSHNNSGYGAVVNYTAGSVSGNLGAQQMDDQNGRKIGTVVIANAAWQPDPWVFKAGTAQFHQLPGGVLYRLNGAVNPAAFATVPSVEQTNRLHNLGFGYKVDPDWFLTAGAYFYRRKGDSRENITLYTLQGDYAVNKYLTAYGIVSAARNGATANQSAGYYSLATVPGAGNSAITVGLRASFDASFGSAGVSR